MHALARFSVKFDNHCAEMHVVFGALVFVRCLVDEAVNRRFRDHANYGVVGTRHAHIGAEACAFWKNALVAARHMRV